MVKKLKGESGRCALGSDMGAINSSTLSFLKSDD